MFARFGHGHSLALGVVLTLALERHALLVVVVCFTLGVLVGRLWGRLGGWYRRVEEKILAPRPTPKRKAVARW